MANLEVELAGEVGGVREAQAFGLKEVVDENLELREYVEKGRVLHEGGVGYRGRSGAWVLAATLVATPFADYYKTFLVDAPNFLHYGELDLEAERALRTKAPKRGTAAALTFSSREQKIVAGM